MPTNNPGKVPKAGITTPQVSLNAAAAQRSQYLANSQKLGGGFTMGGSMGSTVTVDRFHEYNRCGDGAVARVSVQAEELSKHMSGADLGRFVEDMVKASTDSTAALVVLEHMCELLTSGDSSIPGMDALYQEMQMRAAALAGKHRGER